MKLGDNTKQKERITRAALLLLREQHSGHNIQIASIRGG